MEPVAETIIKHLEDQENSEWAILETLSPVYTAEIGRLDDLIWHLLEHCKKYDGIIIRTNDAYTTLHTRWVTKDFAATEIKSYCLKSIVDIRVHWSDYRSREHRIKLVKYIPYQGITIPISENV